MPTVKRLPADPVQPFGKAVPRNMLTVGEVRAELQIAQSTIYEWRIKGTGLGCIELPNGQLRMCRADLEAQLNARGDAA